MIWTVEMQLCGALILSIRPWEKSIQSRVLHNCWQIRTSGMLFLPVKSLGPFEHVHEVSMKQIFRFRHEIFHCYGYLFFHIQCTWWRNFYFMLHIIKGFSTKYVVYENTNIHSNKIFHVCFAILQKITEETCKNVQWK